MEQRSPEWFEARRGKVTSSSVADIFRKGQGGKPSKMRETYLFKLFAERLQDPTMFPLTDDGYKSGPMIWGEQQEEAARSMYTFMTGNELTEIGFVDHPEIPNAGCSPDALLEENGRLGLIEMKCPNTATHMKYRETETPDSDYVTQMYWQMACCRAAFCDFISFDPRLPGRLSIWIKRYHWDDDLIRNMEDGVAEFIKEIDEKVAQYKDEI